LSVIKEGNDNPAMNDFLKSMREREKQADKSRRPYSNPQYRNQDNRGGAPNRKPPFVRFVTVEEFQAVIGENLPFLKSFLETLSESRKRQADASERIARAEELKGEAVKALADALKARGKAQSPALNPAGSSAGIAEAAVETAVETLEEEGAHAPVQAEPETQVSVDRKIKSKAPSEGRSRKPVQSKTIRPETGVKEKVLKAIVNNPGIDFRALVKKTGLEASQVQNALPPLKKAGKIRSEGKSVYFPNS
jgi:hypothetical protein